MAWPWRYWPCCEIVNLTEHWKKKMLNLREMAESQRKQLAKTLISIECIHHWYSSRVYITKTFLMSHNFDSTLCVVSAFPSAAGKTLHNPLRTEKVRTVWTKTFCATGYFFLSSISPLQRASRLLRKHWDLISFFESNQPNEFTTLWPGVRKGRRLTPSHSDTERCQHLQDWREICWKKGLI